MADVVIMPKLGFDMVEGTLVRWIIQEGEAVSKGEILAEIETDKATVEVESAYDGVLRRQLVEEGTVVPISTPIAVIGGKDEPIDLEALVGAEAFKEPSLSTVGEHALEVAEKPIEKAVEAEPEGARLPRGVRASPLARRMAEERGVDLRHVSGSGSGGRVTKADILTYIEGTKEAVTRPMKVVPVMEGEVRPERRIPLSRLWAVIGRRMAEAKQRVPHFYVTHEYDMSALVELRRQVNALLSEEEKNSINDYLVKATSLALREFPNLNASIDEARGEIVQHGQVNIGVAVAVEDGLLTVVCRDADIKPVAQISREVSGMVMRVRQGKVRPEDIEGSTFTVSNMGMYDVENFTAIINPPEAAILAVGSVREVAVVVDGEVKPALRMKATLSVDHRVSDGVEGARFLQALGRYLEQPLRLVV